MDTLRVGKDSIYALIDEGKLEAHQNKGRSAHYQITVRSVVAWLALTANYTPDDLPTILLELIKTLPRAQRERIAAELTSPSFR